MPFSIVHQNFDKFQGGFRVTVYSELEDPAVEELGETSEKIIMLIKGDPDVTIKEIAKILKRSTRSVEMQVQKLSSVNKNARIRGGKGCHWRLLN